MSLRIRAGRAEDGPALAAIYAPFVRAPAVSFDEEAPGSDEMAARVAKATEAFPFLVAEGASGDVLGYAYAGPYRTRRAYRYSAEVSVYLGPEARGRGVGRALYEPLLSHLKAHGFRSAIAIIALPNAASVGFHEAFGFEPCGVLRDVGHKFGDWHDTGFWQKML